MAPTFGFDPSDAQRDNPIGQSQINHARAHGRLPARLDLGCLVFVLRVSRPCIRLGLAPPLSLLKLDLFMFVGTMVRKNTALTCILS